MTATTGIAMAAIQKTVVAAVNSSLINWPVLAGAIQARQDSEIPTPARTAIVAIELRIEA